MRIVLVAAVGSVMVLSAAAACRPNGQEELRAAERGPADSARAGTMPVLASAGVDPGIHPSVLLGNLHNPYAGNAAAASEGRQLFVSYNCSGCHGGRAGGGMGPSLRDNAWAYGDSDVQIYSSIFEGRPAGMPAWGAKLSADQIWKLETYIRTLATPSEPDAPPPQDHPPLSPSDG
jgi:cbb3-type cytochrome c oxidase subunit III